MTLRTRLTAAFLVVVLVPLLVGAALALGLFPRTAREAQGSGLTASAGLAVAAVAERCRRVEAAAEAVAQAAGQEEAALDAAVTRLLGAGVVDGVLVVDAGGAERVLEGQVPVLPAPDCRTAQVASTGALTSLAVRLPLLRAQGPGADAADAGQVVVAAAVDDEYAGELRSAAGVGAVVLLADGRPVAASGRVDEDLLRAALASDGVVRVDGQVAVDVQLEDQPLGVLVVQRQAWAPVPAWALVPALVLAAGGIATAIGSGLARAITRPLEELGRAASRVAEGDLTPRLSQPSGDEVGRLAQAFDVMTARLAVQLEALEDSREQLRAGVARIGSALAGTHDLDRLLPVVLDTAMAATRARAGAVLLREDTSGDLVLSVGRNLGERGVPSDLRLGPGQGITGAVGSTGAPLRGRTGTGPGRLAAGPGEPQDVPFVAVPLSSSERSVGVLLLWDRVAGEGPGTGVPVGEVGADQAEPGGSAPRPGGDADFGEQDLTTLLAFASQATVAVDNVLLHEELRRQSVTDGLTGVANFRAFTATVGREVERATRFHRPLALLLLDLDRFKSVNDVWGHLRGDAVLVELAERVRGEVREVDTVARYGGEEFVVVLPETDARGAAQTAERICAAVRRRPFGAAGEPPLEVTVSIGAAVFPDHGTSSTELLRRADEAMYAAKHGGRDGWRLASVEPAAAGGPSVGSPP